MNLKIITDEELAELQQIVDEHTNYDAINIVECKLELLLERIRVADAALELIPDTNRDCSNAARAYFKAVRKEGYEGI